MSLIGYNKCMENENKYEIKKLSQFDDWIKKLRDVKAKVSIFRRVDRLKKGNFGDCKSVGEGVSELRIKTGKGYRVYFKNEDKKIIIILIAGDKSTQTKDIEKAKELAKGNVS